MEDWDWLGPLLLEQDPAEEAQHCRACNSPSRSLHAPAYSGAEYRGCSGNPSWTGDPDHGNQDANLGERLDNGTPTKNASAHLLLPTVAAIMSRIQGAAPERMA